MSFEGVRDRNTEMLCDAENRIRELEAEVKNRDCGGGVELLLPEDKEDVWVTTTKFTCVEKKCDALENKMKVLRATTGMGDKEGLWATKFKSVETKTGSLEKDVTVLKCGDKETNHHNEKKWTEKFESVEEKCVVMEKDVEVLTFSVNCWAKRNYKTSREILT